MVHLPFREKKSDKSELVKMAKAERARHSTEEPSRAQVKSKDKLTGSEETLSKPKPILPQIDTASSSPPGYSELVGPHSPPEFPQRSGSAPCSGVAPRALSPQSPTMQPTSPKTQVESPTTPSIGRNPFSNTQASGDTPKIPPNFDPLFDCMFHTRNVAAEQMPTVVTPGGPRSTSAGKGKFGTDQRLAKDKDITWVQNIMTDESTEATDVFPAMAVVKKRTITVFPKTKTTPRVSRLLLQYSNENLTCLWQQSSPSRRNQRPRDRRGKGRTPCPLDYLKVDIPQVTLDIWPELHAEIEHMPV
jgi:hypothetical protein